MYHEQGNSIKQTLFWKFKPEQLENEHETK